MQVDVVADSIYEGVRLTTMVLHYPRILLPELNTHRAFSRSTQSNRAVSAARLRALVREDDFIPCFSAEQKGMQGQPLAEDQEWAAELLWRRAREAALTAHEIGESLGLHKQTINRVLEPYQMVKTIVTATDWDNFFQLRCSHLAQPEMHVLASSMQWAREESVPVERGEHVPFDPKEGVLWDRMRIAAARCARISYLGKPGEDMALSKRLSDDGHMSPFEHIAIADKRLGDNRNFRRPWVQFRALLENVRC